VTAKRKSRRFNAGALYRTVTRLHGAIPYHLSPSGYAFPPWHYFLEVTRRCNLRCRMCQYTAWFEHTPAADQVKGELTTDEWKDVIDQTGWFSLITFTGGEPLVRDDFVELLRHASQKRRTHFITNGTRLSLKKAHACVGLAPYNTGGTGLNSVGVSLQGTRDVQNAIAGQDDAFERVTEGIRALCQYRDERGKRCPLVHVTAVIQQDNLDVLPEMPAIVAGMGADVLNLAIEIRFFELEGVGKRDPEELDTAKLRLPRIDRKALALALQQTEEAAQKAGIELRLPRMPREELLQYYDGGTCMECFECRSAWTNLNVGADGGVYPCFIYRLGSVREESLRKLWNGPRMRQFRRRIRQGVFPICQGCCELGYVADRCQHAAANDPAP